MKHRGPVSRSTVIAVTVGALSCVVALGLGWAHAGKPAEQRSETPAQNA